MIKKDYRRDNLRTNQHAADRQQSDRIARNQGLQCIKCRVTAQFLPGVQSPFEDDINLDPQMWQVCVIPEDSNSQSYANVLRDKSFTVRGDPEVLMQTYGSHGMLNKVVNLYFSALNIRATGEVDLNSAASFGVNKSIDTKDTTVAKSIDLSLASLLP